MIDYNTRLLYSMKYFGALTMRYRFLMKEPVDGDILERAMQKTMKRYPYLAKKVVIRDGAFVLEDNPLPVPVFQTTSPAPLFGTKEMNEHLICADYEGNTIYLTMSHNLGGGRGLMRWCLSVIYQYVWDRYGKDPAWEGVRRPDQSPEPGEELIQPLMDLPEIEPVWKGFGPEVKPILPSELEKAMAEEKEEGQFFTNYMLDEAAVMARVKELHASPAVWFAVIYYRALSRFFSEKPEYMSMGVTCDVSDQYGCSESMSLVTKFLHFVIARDDAGLDTASLCNKGRAMLKEQRDPGATNELLKKERDTLAEMEKLEGVEAKAKYYLNHSLIADMVPSALVSYVGKYAVPGMEEYVDAFLLGGVCSASGLVITAPEGRFCAQIAHKYEDAKLLTAFEEELAAEGIGILHTERNVAQNNIGISLPTE